MKAARHAMILELIDKYEIETQDELAAYLRENNFSVTQATVSRDIKELRLIKSLSADGGYKYATVDKTEAGLQDRFIRIFSELSGSIRYAAQKRIMIEIALIKLCKPEMETKSDALVDRIRAVEEKLEKGIPVAAMPAGGYPAAGYNADSATVVAQPPVKREMPKALPEEIKDIVSKWPAIVATADGFLKTQLKHAKLSLSTDNKLLLIVEDGIGSDYFNLDGKKQEVDELISNYMQKQVEVTIQSISPNRNFDDEYVDLSQFIMTEIEEEDE